jgi:hypothetical protein
LYQHDFDQMWSGLFSVHKSISPITTITYNGLPLGVYFSPEDEAMAEILSVVNNAQHSIDFTIFFFTNDDLRDALIAAHERGVQIRGVWDLLGAASPFSDDEALCAQGIALKIEDTTGKMHNKWMVVDAAGVHPSVVTGSMNWSSAGDISNDENTVIVTDGDIAQAYATQFNTIWQALDPEMQCNVDTPPLSNRLYLPLLRTASDGTAPTTNIQLQRIVYNPAGDDLAGELIEIANVGGQGQQLHNWTLVDVAGHTFTFPDLTLSPGGAVRVWVKSGVNTPADIYWGFQAPVWNNDGDTAYLYDAAGGLQDSCSYAGGDIFAICP